MVTDLYIAIVIGTILSLLFVEITGITPAGLIVPGYMALVLDQPIFVLVVFAISVLTYIFVKKVLSKHIILYGRRKFTAMLITAILLKIGFDLLYPYIPLAPFQAAELRGIGIVVPGLIANTIDRQGMILTLGSSLLLSGITFVAMMAYYVIL
ncbi:poly-gamma-glutamate biosynthesis protein PgsC [Serpentinicella sp. ANB-PHB4]|uniref:poly-gamma-glutamate biosynthesis protein PgsC n=1 Tax=Serpentinicella sp. ANB-PHB4 TaxID=3074076 RepID=UPI002857EBD8|nr:poly-gamma-glutamate biosynthesis protein PgsC [Serpentinicella sp. ANB-PHB4]MDR5658797.1 poly-gamma-glutamate biosynthesis protein PgsC [Serpentinicella sp. ANB-PHB4]